MSRGASAVLALTAALAATAYGQANLPAESLGGPMTGPAVIGAPFSADATTTVHATLGDGTRLDQSTTDRYYRDSIGRVRVEKLMNGLPAPTTMAERHVRTIIDPEPGDGAVLTLDAQTRTARYNDRSLFAETAGGSRWFSVPVGGARFLTFYRAGDLLSADPSAFGDVRDESLGSQRIAGVETTGRRITLVVPPGYRRNDQFIEMVDERWESADLKLLVQSRHSDSRSTIDYRLSNVQRIEPPAYLFEMPLDYTVDRTPTIKDPWWSSALADSPRAGAFRAGRAK
jgi:hypothetical protein